MTDTALSGFETSRSVVVPYLFLAASALRGFKVCVFCCHSFSISGRHRVVWIQKSAFCCRSSASGRHRAVWFQDVRSVTVHCPLLVATGTALSAFKTFVFCCRSFSISSRQRSVRFQVVRVLLSFLVYF